MILNSPFLILLLIIDLETEKVWDEVDAKYQKQTFVHETSSEATRRLISDVKALMRSNSKKNGFTATPINVNGAENLYVWEVC